jgi:DNA-binding CsgD family transcriptional regulator
MTEKLSEREREVVRLVSLGCTLVEAAKILQLAPSTVDHHKTHAMAKLGVNKAALLTRVAIKLRITSLRDQLTVKEKRRSGRRNDGWNQ